jgi:NTE family protein
MNPKELLVAQGNGKTAFVFSGGGSLGAIQVGMLRVLLAAGVCPDFVVGASVGAINAAHFACAPDLEGVAALERIWLGLHRTDIFPFTLTSLFGLVKHPGNAVDPSGLRGVIESNLPCGRIDEAKIPLHIMATNLQGLPVRLSSGSAVEAVLASTAIPGVFPPVQIGDNVLMDGAVAANTPLRLAVELGASRIVILPTGYACALKALPRTVIGRALHAITLMINWQLMHELEVCSKEIDVHLVPTLCPLAVSPFDFSASRQLIARAADSSQKWIESGGLQRRASPQELAPHRH